MNKDLVAKAFVTIEAPEDAVWSALVDPDAIKEYMFGAEVRTDWRQGSAITWKGSWQGKDYEDKGVVLTVKPGRTLQYSHFSPLSGLPDTPDNYHTVTIELFGEGKQTRVALSQDKNPSEHERELNEENWNFMLEELKRFVEQ
jgi:uncharacterized protein YndB with AHSA1/START domain